jgi:hypothetical protein
MKIVAKLGRELVSGVAQFPSAEMSIERDGVYEVLLPF